MTASTPTSDHETNPLRRSEAVAESEGDSTRERVLRAAGPIFAENGFEQATVREICDAAGANLASVNYHFGDKKTLYIETIRQAHARRMQRGQRAEWDANTPPEAKLERFIRMLLSRMVASGETPWEFRLMMQEMHRPIGACEALVEEFIRPEFRMLCGILSEMLPADVTEAERYRIAFSIVGQCLFYKVGRKIGDLLITPPGADPAPDPLDALVAHVTRFSLAAVRGWSASASELPSRSESPS